MKLIHPSDVKQISSFEEDGKRHWVCFLNNPIVKKSVTLKNRRITGHGETRKIGQIFLMKRIGEFSQTPFVNVNVSNEKRVYSSQFNKSHIKTLPEVINYDLSFKATDKQADLLLAQDLFSRVSNYNEFITWIHGGNIEDQKVFSMKGLRFIDLIKSLTADNFNFHYVDGRVTSGITFNMTLKEVI